MVRSVSCIEEAIVTANEWVKKEEPTRALRCIEYALIGHLQHAVRRASFTEGVVWLRSHGVDQLLDRYRRTTYEVCQLIDGGRWPGSVIGGNFGLLVSSHVALCLHRVDFAGSFVAVARRPDVLETSTPFWSEYSHGLEALMACSPYEIGELSLNADEQYSYCYLELMSAASLGKPLDDLIVAVDDSFKRRNHDQRLDRDPYAIDGCGDEPVQWDYRRDGLLVYIAGAQRETKG